MVVSFGAERAEINNYVKYLERARKAGVKANFKIIMGIAFLFFCIYACYAYAFWMGGIFIHRNVYNPVSETKTYRAGDILSCFFGTLFGLISILTSTANIKGIIEGQVAGKMAFDVIERTP